MKKTFLLLRVHNIVALLPCRNLFWVALCVDFCMTSAHCATDGEFCTEIMAHSDVEILFSKRLPRPHSYIVPQMHPRRIDFLE